MEERRERERERDRERRRDESRDSEREKGMKDMREREMRAGDSKRERKRLSAVRSPSPPKNSPRCENLDSGPYHPFRRSVLLLLFCGLFNSLT